MARSRRSRPRRCTPWASRRRRKKPGAKNGHPGTRRRTPATIDARVEHRLDACPCCGGTLQRCNRARRRLVEDIPEQIKPVVTEHTLHRDYCPSCKKHVEPVVPDAMPNATLGHHVIALSSWFHYGLGVTIGQVRDILASHLHTQVTAGGLVDGWRRLAEALEPWYEQIARRGQRLGGSARRRDGLAGGWPDPLALVLHQCSQLLLPDRPEPRLAGPAQVLHRG